MKLVDRDNMESFCDFSKKCYSKIGIELYY